MSQDQQSSEPQEESAAGLLFPIIGLLLVVAGALLFLKQRQGQQGQPPPAVESVPDPRLAAAYTGDFSSMGEQENLYSPSNLVTYWWGDVSPAMRAISVDTGTNSNIRIDDYAGAAACAECHRQQHADWLGHSHRQMSAPATSNTVLGDFSGSQSLDYQGGTIRFMTQLGSHRVLLTKGERSRLLHITRTIGSRIHQYYVGVMIEGEEADTEELRLVHHVMPFAWSIAAQEWIPTSHTHRNHDRSDHSLDVYAGSDIVSYEADCAFCHTTNPFGDWLLPYQQARRLSNYSPSPVAFEISRYLSTEHPTIIPNKMPPERIAAADYEDVSMRSLYLGVEGHRVSDGISCEACHYGSKAHAAASAKEASPLLPSWFPINPHLHSPGEGIKTLTGRTAANGQLMCARCHSGDRPTFANGAHTWHSAEFSDAVNGACYVNATGRHRNTLTCTTCHDAHRSSRETEPGILDQNCVSCHEQFQDPAALAEHTHHQPESAGSSCMNCHMPRISEGLQDIVRSHRITKPTDSKMIEANQPNACNLCHLDQPIDWTIRHLRSWYGSEHSYADFELDRNYPQRNQAVGLSWLESKHEPTRMVGADALAQKELPTYVSQLLDILINEGNADIRRFTQRRIEEKLKLRLRDHDYAFYHSNAKRKAAIDKIRAKLETGAAALE